MIGIDPHKRSHTAVALNGTDEILGKRRVETQADQVETTPTSSRSPARSGRCT